MKWNVWGIIAASVVVVSAFVLIVIYVLASMQAEAENKTLEMTPDSTIETASTDPLIKQINDAISAAERVCLSGSKVEFELLGDGSLSIKKLSPGVNVQIKVDKTIARGAQFFDSEEVKRLVDQDIRTCMRDEWPKIQNLIQTLTSKADLKPKTRKFTLPRVINARAGDGPSGTLTGLGFSVTDIPGKPATFVAEWTWSGTAGGGSQGGSQSIIFDLKSDTGATVQTLAFGIDRSHCFDRGHPERKSGKLKIPASIIHKVVASATVVEGKVGRC